MSLATDPTPSSKACAPPDQGPDKPDRPTRPS